VSRAPRSLAALAAVALGGFAFAACGIPTQPSASPISAGQIQPTLPNNRQPTSPCVKSGCTTVDVYFVAPGGHLRPVSRVVPPHAKIGTVVGALLGGPTASERATGIGSALGSGIRLLSTEETAKKKTVTLNFNADFGTLSGTKWVLGVAQVVYTVSSVMPGVAVIFEIAGAQTEVPLETGALWTGAVRVSQYGSLLTPRATTTTAP
jgi:spore germination protein GerM